MTKNKAKSHWRTRRKVVRHRKPLRRMDPSEGLVRAVGRITKGSLAGRNIADLSDGELGLFLQSPGLFLQSPDACNLDPRSWLTPPPPPSPLYLAAHLEKHRRELKRLKRLRVQPGSVSDSVPLTIDPRDDHKQIALKLFKAGYRRAAQTYHPDRDGDEQAMRKVNKAKEWMEAQVRRS